MRSIFGICVCVACFFVMSSAISGEKARSVGRRGSSSQVFVLSSQKKGLNSRAPRDDSRDELREWVKGEVQKAIREQAGGLMVSAAAKGREIVVSVRAEGIVQGRQDEAQGPFNDEFFYHFFYRFFGKPPIPSPRGASQGSGFFISEDGYIATNFHVIRGANVITVEMATDYGQKEFAASLVGGDPYTDIAVIKIDNDGTPFPFASFADSDRAQVGELVLTVGSQFGLASTVTMGTISAKGRRDLDITRHECFLQVDAPMNPGVSGGPILNASGEVVAMATAILTKTGTFAGIGFGIPSNLLKRNAEQIKKDGVVSRGFLGVSLQPVNAELAQYFRLPHPQGALVLNVEENSPAHRAGIQQGDLILKLNGQPVKDPGSIQNSIGLLSPGTEVSLSILRNGKEWECVIQLGAANMEGRQSSMFSSRLLGMTVDNLTRENVKKYQLSMEGDEGVVVVEVDSGSPADLVQMHCGTLIISINGEKVSNVKEFRDIVSSLSAEKGGSTVLLFTKYKGDFQFYSLDLSENASKKSGRHRR